MTSVRNKIILLMFNILLLIGCATTGINRWQPNIISIEQEKKLGKEFAKQVEQEVRILNDQKGTDYINRLGQQLLGHAEEVHFDYSFKLVDSDEINAFALPGGYVYINRGLIVAADNEGELAGVVSHEIGHVVARHGTERLTTTYGYNLVLSLALGGSSTTWVSLLADLFGRAGILAYSRSQESESDELGVHTLYKAGYDPRAMASFFAKLQQEKKRKPGLLGKFFSSHPLTNDRIEHAEEIIRGFSLRPDLKLDSSEFQLVKARLRKK
jgi:predicted Zn-dependent protease